MENLSPLQKEFDTWFRNMRHTGELPAATKSDNDDDERWFKENYKVSYKLKDEFVK